MIIDRQTRARELREVIEAAAQTADEKTISEAPELCRTLKQDGKLVSAGTRINWNGTIKKAGSDLWDTEANDPDHAPSLWADIAYRDGYRIIPETITVTTAFSKGEKGWWTDGKIYRAKANGTVWTPAQYPDAWEEMGGENNI